MPGVWPRRGQEGFSEAGTQERRVSGTGPEASFEEMGVEVFTGQSQVKMFQEEPTASVGGPLPPSSPGRGAYTIRQTAKF